MKKIKLYIIPSILVILSFLVFSGCYTQLAIQDDEPEGIVVTEPIDYPPPPTPCNDCWPSPPPPPPGPPIYYPPTIVTSPIVTQPQPQPQPRRDWGDQRMPTSSQQTDQAPTSSSGNQNAPPTRDASATTNPAISNNSSQGRR